MLRTILLTGLMATPLQAQGSEYPSPPSPKANARVPDFQLQTAEDGSLWAWGGSYKASASQDGFQYIPFLGSDAPCNRPLRFVFEEATRGGRVLGGLPDAQPKWDGAEFVFDRGSVLERYALATDHVEQLFELLDESGQGDLVVRLRVETDLDARALGGGFEFRSERGSVRYGAAEVLDGAGRRAPVPARLEGGMLELTVPEAFLESAQGTVLIDPVISTFGVSVGPLISVDSDLASDMLLQRYLVVEERAFSATDHDLVLVHLDLMGTVLGTEFLDLTSNDWREPAVAYSMSGNRFMVVSQVKPVGSSVNQILARLVNSNFTIVPGATNVSGLVLRPVHPDVGGNPNPQGDGFCVVFESQFVPDVDHDIWAQRVGSSGVPAGSLVAIDNDFGLDRMPSISNSCGAGGAADGRYWNIVWEREVSSIDHDIHGAQLRYDGGILVNSFPIDTDSGDDRFPCASSPLDDYSVGLRRWMVTYQSKVTGSASFVQATALDGCQVRATENLAELQGLGQGWADSQPSVDSTGSQFVVAWQETVPSIFVPDDWDIRGASLYMAGDQLLVSESFVDLGSNGQPEGRPKVYSRRSSGGAGGFTMASWVETTSTTGNIRGSLYLSPSGYGSSIGSNYCGPAEPNSTGNSSTIVATGSARTMGEPMHLLAYDLPPFQFSHFFVGTANGISFPASSSGKVCVSGEIGRYNGPNVQNTGPIGIVQLAVDTLAIPTPSGTPRPVLPGETLYFQCWYRDVGTNNFSDAVQVFFF